MSQDKTPAGEQDGSQYNPYAPPRADQPSQPPSQPLYRYPQTGSPYPQTAYGQPPQAPQTGYGYPQTQQDFPQTAYPPPGYMPPQQGYPGYPTGPVPPRKKSLAWLWILLGVVAVLVIGVVVAVVLIVRANSSLDALYSSCYAGDADACEQLYQDSEAGSSEEWFGQTCGGRTDGTVSCDHVDMSQPANSYTEPTAPEDESQPAAPSESTDAAAPTDSLDDFMDGLGLPEPGMPAPGTVPDLDPLWESCASGDMAACDDLYSTAYDQGFDDPMSAGYEYFEYGLWCGGDPDRMWELTCEP